MIWIHSFSMEDVMFHHISRWQFHQSDETRSLSANFEAKLSAISVVGVRGGEARNCTQCPAGYYSFADRTDCGICGKGFYSAAGSTKCTQCPELTFAPKVRFRVFLVSFTLKWNFCFIFNQNRFFWNALIKAMKNFAFFQIAFTCIVLACPFWE